MKKSSAAQNSRTNKLLKVLDKVQGLQVLVLGDLILDRYIWGKVERISPEAPVPVVHVNRTEDRLGGAGNVVRNLAELGCKIEICGSIGVDEEGLVLQKLLTASQVGTDGLVTEKEQPTTVKTRVIAHSQQIVRIDREIPPSQPTSLSKSFLNRLDKLIENAAVVIVSDYGKGFVSKPLMSLLAQKKKMGKIIVVDPSPENFHLYSGISLAKPNRKEAEMASGVVIRDRDSAIKAGKILSKKWKADLMLISLGEDGLMIIGDKIPKGVFLATTAQEVFDVSGAGDTVTAVFSAALGAKAPPQLAGELANLAAGIVVSEIGTVAIDRDKLIRRIG